MKSKLRVLFMGTPEFARHILEKIIDSGYEIAAVVSVPDKPAGRGQKIHSSEVAKFAREKDLLLLQPEKLKSKKFLEQLHSLNIDVAVVVAFRMLPKEIWSIPKLGTFNLHASLLPQYRGAAPINHVIMNGETQTGVTTFFIDEKIDTGNILLKKATYIAPDENAGELHDRLMQLGADLVVETLEGLRNGNLKAVPQSSSEELKDAPKIFRDDCEINWNDCMENIYNFIRGLSPYPAAWTTLMHNGEEKTLKIYKAGIQYGEHNFPLKRMIISEKKPAIAHREGLIFPEEVQLEGKKRMDFRDFMNGFSISESTMVK